MKKTLEPHALRIMSELGLPATIEPDRHISNQVKTVTVTSHGVEVYAQVTCYEGKSFQAEVCFSLPEEGVLAETFMDECAKIENTPKNEEGRYCSGPRYPKYGSSPFNKRTCAFSPWNNHYFIAESRYYPIADIQEAVDNVITLARDFVKHLDLVTKLRFWKEDDPEVIAKEKEIVENASFRETDCDRETRSHWLRDDNSFFKGWFNPWNDRGTGTFDTIWPSSIDYAASAMGIKGSFEYAVACRLLVNPEYIAKARKACHIRRETVTIAY